MKQSQAASYAIGDRIECAGQFGTIKYIGLIQDKPSLWLGIDWDDPQRGKHNGSINGVQYFTTKAPQSGSFVRPDKVSFGKSAQSSIESRYGSVEDEFTVKVNQQKKILLQQTMNAPFLEMVGFDKIFNIQSNFQELRVVNLRNQNVSSAGLKLGEICPNIEELDISKNLFVSWLDIVEICRQLKRLHWLNVSENRLSIPDTLSDQNNFPNLKTLICGSMELTWGDIVRVIPLFPSVEEFRVPHNKIETITTVGGLFQHLTLLDIEANHLVNWSEICKFAEAPKLEHLVIENIVLQTIEFKGDEETVSILKNLRKLCISNNNINEWNSISQLNRLQSLDNLKISKNPILESEDKNTVHQLLIAKIANLKILNGVEIEVGERRGAEYDYIKKFGLEWLKVKGTSNEKVFLKMHNRYLELIQMHGEPEESELIIKPKVIKSSLVELNLTCNGSIIVKKLPQSLTIQKLLVMVQKIFSLNDRPSLIYISRLEPQIEISLTDEMKEIGTYSMENGDKIFVRT